MNKTEIVCIALSLSLSHLGEGWNHWILISGSVFVLITFPPRMIIANPAEAQENPNNVRVITCIDRTWHAFMCVTCMFASNSCGSKFLVFGQQIHTVLTKHAITSDGLEIICCAIKQNDFVFKHLLKEWWSVRTVIQIYKFMWSDMNCTGAQNVAIDDGTLRTPQNNRKCLCAA